MNTILGNVSPSELGRTLPHEHILVGSAEMLAAFGDRWVDRKKLTELAVKEVEVVRDRYGISTIIDGTASDTCRDLEIIREVSLRTGVHMPYCTGLYHFEMSSYARKTPEEFAKYFIDECENGSANRDGSLGSSKPAFLKCATDVLGVTPVNRVELATMAIVQRETGLPLYCHNKHSEHTATEQIKVFKEYGADLCKVIIGHASDTADIPYLTSLLEEGCSLSFDRIGPRQDDNSAHAATIAALVKAGYTDRLMMSHDHCVYLDFGNAKFESTYAKGPYDLRLDFTYISRVFPDRLKAQGVTDAEIDTMMITVPAKVYGNGEA